MKKRWNRIKTFFSKPYNVLLVLFLVVKAFNKARNAKKEEEEEPAGPSEVDLLTEIKDLLEKK